MKISELKTIIAGIPDEFEFEVNSQKRTSINLGSWFEPAKALCLTDKGTLWKELS